MLSYANKPLAVPLDNLTGMSGISVFIQLGIKIVIKRICQSV